MNTSMNRITFDTNVDGFTSKNAVGMLPEPLPQPLYLNLGCGPDVRNGFVNIDLFSDNPNVVKMDIRRLELPDNSVDLILASDVLEHFSHRETDAVLAEWARVLKPNAAIIIRCPSLRLQAKAYMNDVWNADVASFMIFGGQKNPGDYHCIGFDETSIRSHLQKAGLQVVSFEEVDTPQNNGFINLNMTVKAIKQAQIIAMPQYDYEKKFTNEQANAHPIKHQINIVWEGSQLVYHSLALINREICINIAKADAAELTIVPYEPDQFTAAIDPRFAAIAKNDIRYKDDVPKEIEELPYAWIRHQWPPKAEPPQGAKWIIMQPWEFSLLPDRFVDIFQKADEIWTPSNFSRQAFVDSGISFDKVQIIPNGINPELFKPTGDTYKLNTNKRFKILYLGGTIYRKGFDILLHAYLKAFTKDDDVCLVVKDFGSKVFYKGQTAENIIQKAQTNPDCPEIIYMDTDLSEQEIAALYRACNVYASPYRGEGFSLPTLEAMASGLPVIVTRGGCTDDFTNEDIAWYINAERRSMGNAIYDDPTPGEVFMLEPDVNELIDTLKHLYNNPVGMFSQGIIAASTARKNWTWQRSTLKVLTRLDYLYGTDMAVKSQDTLGSSQDDACIILGDAEQAFCQNNVEVAADLFVKALEMDVLDDKCMVHAFNRLAQISITGGDMLAAYKYNEAAKMIDADNPDTVWLETVLLASENKYVEALERITPTMDNWHQAKFNSTLGLNLDKHLLIMADILVQMGDYEGAMQIYSATLKWDNYSAEACYGLGICYKEAGMLSEAKEMFDWAIKYNPEYKNIIN